MVPRAGVWRPLFHFFFVAQSIFVRRGTSCNELQRKTTGFDITSAWHEGVSEVLPTSSAGCHPWRPSAFSQTGGAPCQGNTHTHTHKILHNRNNLTNSKASHCTQSKNTFDFTGVTVLLSATATPTSHLPPIINTHQCTLNTRRWVTQGLNVTIDFKSHYVKAPPCVSTGYKCTF